MEPMTFHLLRAPWPIVDYACNTLAFKSAQILCVGQAEDRPHVMDDYTVGRVREVHSTQRNDLWLYEEQLARWSTADSTLAQRQEIDRLTHQLDRLRSVLTLTLALTDALREGTIEKVMAKSDIELAIEVLTGKRKC